MNTASIVILLAGLTGVCLLLAAAWWLWGLGPAAAAQPQPLPVPADLRAPAPPPPPPPLPRTPTRPPVARPGPARSEDRTQFEAPPAGAFEPLTATQIVDFLVDDEDEAHDGDATMLFNKGDSTQLLPDALISNDPAPVGDVPEPREERARTRPMTRSRSTSRAHGPDKATIPLLRTPPPRSGS